MASFGRWFSFRGKKRKEKKKIELRNRLNFAMTQSVKRNKDF
ncbi:hypothetical protein SKA34_05145 [Photobacterium sp. SKA34]|nr:hypothetical protein SKA34_05145 [Photobacterium sp. SKA34]